MCEQCVNAVKGLLDTKFCETYSFSFAVLNKMLSELAGASTEAHESWMREALAAAREAESRRPPRFSSDPLR